MRATTMKMVLAGLLLTALTGCKLGAEKQKFIDKFSINKNQVSFEYVTTFSENIEAGIEGEFPIGNYGSVAFFNDAKGRLNIGLSASFNVFSDINLQEVSTLPNGANFPAIVTGPLHQLQLTNNNGRGNLFLLVDKAGKLDEGVKLAGLAMELSGINNNFPQISITQSLYNDQNKRVASFTLYGPRKVNGVTIAGGLFVIGDINAAVSGKTKLYRGEATIHGPETSKYKSSSAQLKLMEMSEKALAEHNIYLHFR
ncbi:hypothetical protein D3C87_110380 [compost metagenome]